MPAYGTNVTAGGVRYTRSQRRTVWEGVTTAAQRTTTRLSVQPPRVRQASVPAPKLRAIGTGEASGAGAFTAPAPSVAATGTHTLPGSWTPPTGLKIWAIAPTAGDRVLIPSITTGPDADVEIVAKVQKTTATTGTDFSRYVYGETTSGEFESALSHHEDTDATHWHAIAGKATVDSVRASSTETIALNTSTLLRGRWDGTADTVTVSVNDGTPVSTGYNANVQSATPVTGAWTVFASGLPIVVEEVLVWNRLLTDLEWADVRDHLTAVAVTGTGAITAPSPSLAGTAAETFTGSGGVTAPASSLAATGAETFSGTGALTAPAPALAGTGAETVTGTGTVTAPKPTLAATGTVSAVGSGAVTAPAPSLAGTATETFTGTGALTAPAPSRAGTGAETFSGTGAVTAPAPSLAGTGTSTDTAVSGSGALTAPAPTLAGTGTHTPLAVTGTGALVAPAPSLAGAGALLVGVVGGGAVIAPAPVLAGILTTAWLRPGPTVRPGGSPSRVQPSGSPALVGAGGGGSTVKLGSRQE